MANVSESTTSSEDNAVLFNYDTSRGSSVSSGMQEEYNELLKYAVVAPKWDPQVVNKNDVNLPQLQLQDPDNLPLTNVDYYEDGTNSSTAKIGHLESVVSSNDKHINHQYSEELDGRDSAMGSDEITSDRKTFRENPLPTTGLYDQTNPQFTSTMQTYRQSTLKSNPTTTQDISDMADLDLDLMKMLALLHKSNTTSNNMIMAEVNQIKRVIQEDFRRQLFKEQQDHKFEINKLQEEIENLKELLNTYENSLKRKDSVISNLTQAVHTYKEKQEMLKVLTYWKLRLVDEKRQNFTTKLAKKVRERQLSLQTWQAWRSVVENNWKVKVEKACQQKAQEVCKQLTEDHEKQLSVINDALEESRQEVERLHQERDKNEDTMKKAFMRGVCALNLEAMSMFTKNETDQDKQDMASVDGTLKQPSCEIFADKSNNSPLSLPLNPPFLPSALKINQVTRPDFAYSNKKINSATLVKKQTISKAPATKSGPTQNKVFACGRSRSRSPAFGSTTVLVKRHHPNIENSCTQQPLSHVGKYPNTPTQLIRSRDSKTTSSKLRHNPSPVYH